MNDWHQPTDKQTGEDQDPTAQASQNYSGYREYGQEPSNQSYKSASQQGNPSATANGYPDTNQTWQAPSTSTQGGPQDPYGQTAYTPQSSGTSGPVQIQPWQLQTQYVSGPGMSNKSKVTAAILAFFLGGFGIHNFYLGKTGRGVAQLLITIFVLFIGPLISSIWAIVEGAQILGSHPGSPYHMDGKGLQLQD